MIIGVYIPIFQPDNMPVGIFADVLTPSMEVPPPFTLEEYNDVLDMPKYNLGESSTAAVKFRGFAGGIDFSLSYVWSRDGLPTPDYVTITPVDDQGGIKVDVSSNYFRQHIFGADMATSVGGLGLWAEAAAFLPQHEIIMTTDVSAIVPGMKIDSTILKKQVFVKFVAGADYNFANGMYLNLQYLHGFMNERGRDELNDYFFVQYQMKFFDDRLLTTPLSGAIIVSDWKDVPNNYAVIFMPELSYMATDNLEIELSTPLFFGKGDNTFVKFTDYNMFRVKIVYSF